MDLYEEEDSVEIDPALLRDNDDDYFTEEDEEDEAILVEVESSHNQLLELLDECDEMVTNVAVASDLREINQRKMDEQARNARIQYLEEQNVNTQKQFDEIVSKWEPIHECNDCLEIYHACEEQKRRCEELLRSKDEVIDVLKRQLAEADERFISNGKIYQDDVNLLSHRIEQSIEIVRNAYSEHIALLQEVTDKQQHLLVEKYHKKWMELYNQYENQKKDDMADRMKLVQEYEEDMQKMYFEFREKYRFTKEQLENELHNLEVRFEEAEERYMLEEKKLEYNYAVLLKREQELELILADQKEKINRLRKIYNKIRETMEASKKEFETRKRKLEKNIVRMKNNHREHQRNMKRMKETNEISFKKTWQIHEKQLMHAIQTLWLVDKRLHEAADKEWKQPNIQPMKINDLPSVQAALRELTDEKETQENENQPNSPESDSSSSLLTNFILEEISKNLKFLCSQLGTLTTELPDQKKTVLNYDYILKVLKVDNDKEMKSLKKHFLPYIRCSTCKNKKYKKKYEIQRPGSATRRRSTTYVIRVRPSSAPLHRSDREDELPKLATSSKTFCMNPLHTWYIDKFTVLNVIAEFIEERARKRKEEKSKPKQKKIYLTETLTKKDIEIYWKRFEDALPTQEDDEYWDNFEKKLKKKFNILKDKNMVKKEIKILENENLEIKRLLSTFEEIAKTGLFSDKS